MKKALVTGASSGIGEAISLALLENNYEIYGIGRDFSNCKINENTSSFSDHFHPLVCDLTDQNATINCINDINLKHDISLFVSNAGVGYYGLHEELNPAKIHELTTVNLEAPMLISNLLLRDLKKNSGAIVFISSVTADKENPHGCAYGATKAALKSFAHSLFAENRKYGLKVINIEPDMTDTNLYRNADFECDNEKGASLYPEDIAKALINALDARDGMVFTDLTIMPQYHRIKRK